MFWKKKNKQQPEQSVDDPQPGMWNTTPIRVVIKTDLGNVRTNNEDSASFFRKTDEEVVRTKGYLLIVADGMGGHLAGEVASKMAVDIISNEYYLQPNSSKEKALAKAFQAANKNIFGLASEKEQYKGMGTTCTALVVAGETVYYGHAGDSRAYFLKRGVLTRITEDHTYVQELVNKGNISPLEATKHPQRNILTNAMGTKPVLQVDTGKCTAPFVYPDRLLICSDGMYDYLADEEIESTLANSTLQEAADYFISEAKRRGGLDNITVVLAEAVAASETNTVKSTREVALPKMTRDSDLPNNIAS